MESLVNDVIGWGVGWRMAWGVGWRMAWGVVGWRV
jgi:hypothetical protein